MASESSGIYEPRCIEVQHQDGVRFAAIIDKKGEKIAGGFREGIVPYEEDENRLHGFYKSAVDLSFQHDHLSTSLGALNYIASRQIGRASCRERV